MHIPKTGGTSLREIVRSHHADDEFVEVYENQFNLVSPNHQFIDSIKARGQRLRAVFGHFSFGAHQLLDVPNPRYLTLLRDPVQRAISFFGHVSREPRSRYYQYIQNGMTLKELVLSHWAPELNNHAIRMLMGEQQWRTARWPPNPHDAPKAIDQLLDRCHLERGIEIIERYFVFVGTTERYADSLALLAEVTRWPLQNLDNIPRRNVRPDAPQAVDEQTLQVLRQYNALGIELHERFYQQPLVSVY
ncbi:MAG TPA: hypothetical protein VGG19_09050 [Tepidisphaeraceae bacterium]